MAALEAAAVWSEPPEENPGCFSDIARRPKTHTHTHRSVGFSGGGGGSREGETETTEAKECSHVLVPPLPCTAETVGRSGFRGRSADTGRREAAPQRQLLLVPHIQQDQIITTGDRHAFFKEIKKKKIKKHSVRAAVQVLQ